MRFNKITITTIVLVTLFSFISCQNGQIDLADDDAEMAEPATSQKSENSELENPIEDITISGDLIPDGVLVSTDNDDGLIYLDSNGQILSEINTPGIGYIDPDSITIAGAIIPGQPLPPIIFRSWEPEQGLMANTNSQISTLRLTNSFLSLKWQQGSLKISWQTYKEKGF